MNPKISVVMSVYNGERFLQAAVDSILQQTYSDFEFIIIDDHSSDATEQILNGFSDQRIVRIKNDHNLGQTRSLNIGIRAARGEYIARMDADDISLEERFAAQVQALDSQPDLGVLGGWVQPISSTGAMVSPAYQYDADPIYLHWMLHFYTLLPHPAVMARKSVLFEAGLYDETLHHAQDFDLWSRVSAISRVSNLQQVILLYRLHEKNMSKAFSENQKQEAYRTIQNALARLTGEPVDIRVARAFREKPTQDPLTAHQTLHTLVKARKLFLQKYGLERGYAPIDHMCAEKAFAIARQHKKHIRFWPYFYNVVSWDASVVKDHLRSRKNRIQAD